MSYVTVLDSTASEDGTFSQLVRDTRGNLCIRQFEDEDALTEEHLIYFKRYFNEEIATDDFAYLKEQN